MTRLTVDVFGQVQKYTFVHLFMTSYYKTWLILVANIVRQRYSLHFLSICRRFRTGEIPKNLKVIGLKRYNDAKT